jgi:Cu-Zn family superoxide dismutase
MNRVRLVIVLALAFSMISLPFALNAQNATPIPVDPLSGDGRLFGNTNQVTPAPTRETPLGLPTPDVLGILSGEVAAPTPAPADDDTARAVFVDTEGTAIGEVAIVPIGGDALAIQISVSGIASGFHALQIHETGLCETGAIDGAFSSAGQPLNLDNADHPNHTGALPALLVMRNGLGGLAVITDRLTLNDLYDEDGSAFVIYAEPDNLAYIPDRYGNPDAETLATGDSRTRIACAAFASTNDSE